MFHKNSIFIIRHYTNNNNRFINSTYNGSIKIDKKLFDKT